MNIEAKKWHESWGVYTKTSCYTGSVQAMKEKGMQQPYIDNILRRAFDAAWGACMDRVKTKVVTKEKVVYRKEPPVLYPHKPKKNNSHDASTI